MQHTESFLVVQGVLLCAAKKKTQHPLVVHEGQTKSVGPVRDLNPGPLAPKARIIPLDQLASLQHRSTHITHHNLFLFVPVPWEWLIFEWHHLKNWKVTVERHPTTNDQITYFPLLYPFSKLLFVPDEQKGWCFFLSRLHFNSNQKQNFVYVQMVQKKKRKQGNGFSLSFLSTMFQSCWTNGLFFFRPRLQFYFALPETKRFICNRKLGEHVGETHENLSDKKEIIKMQKLFSRASPGFEPGTSRTLSENHTPRLTGRTAMSRLRCFLTRPSLFRR